MAKIHSILLLIAGLGIPLGVSSIVTAAQSIESAELSELHSAQSAYDQGNFGEAIASLRIFLKIRAQSFDANELMGLCLVAENHPEQGRHFLDRAVLIQPSSAVAHANLAADLAELKDTVSAEIEFRKALALDPNSAELNHNLGELYASHGKMRSAVPYLKESQKLHPTYNNGYDLALAESQDGELEAAERDLHTLLLQQDTAELHSLLGAVLEKKGDFIAAANEMQDAAHLDPSEDNIFAWGAELLHHQTLKPAAEVFGDGANRFPNSSKFLLGLGVAKYLLENNRDAVAAFCAAIDLDPKDPSPYFLLSNVNRIPPDQQAEVSLRFERHAEQFPKDPKALFYYASDMWDSNGGQLASKDLQKVKFLLEESIAIDPRNAQAHLRLGILYSGQDQHQAAAREFQRCIALDPSTNNARYRLAQTLVRLGEKERARKEMQQWETLKSREQQEEKRKENELIEFLYSKSE